jgi:hypothetical protein
MRSFKIKNYTGYIDNLDADTRRVPAVYRYDLAALNGAYKRQA